MSKLYYSEAAEREADKIGEKFATSSNVMQDMARAYHTDFSSIHIHTDDAADRKVRAAGKDAITVGNNLFFGKGVFESSHPAAKALVGHELAHTMQQNVVSSEMAVQESAPMGAEQGGSLWNWLKGLFGSKEKNKKNKEDELQFSSDPESRKGMEHRELWNTGFIPDTVENYRKGMDADSKDPLMRAIAQRKDLNHVIKEHLQGKEDGAKHLFYNNALENASGTVTIKGLKYSRMVSSLQGTGGGLMSKEEIISLYDKLLSGGDALILSKNLKTAENNLKKYAKKQISLEKEIKELEQTGDAQTLEKKKNDLEELIVLQNDIKSKYEKDIKLQDSYDIKERDQQFDEGFMQLKRVYLSALRRLKTKYGTYITQMHPDDFVSKIGLDFFDDVSILQDTQQMLVDGGKYFDFQNNPDDAEFKLLNDYYGDAYSQISIYFGADMESADWKTFNPSDEGLKFAEKNGYLQKLAMDENTIRKNYQDTMGFTNKEQKAYNKRLKKRYKEKGWLNRLIGRFRK